MWGPPISNLVAMCDARVAAVGGSLLPHACRYKCHHVLTVPLSEAAPDVAGLKLRALPPLSECTTLSHPTFTSELHAATIPELPPSAGVPTMPV
jgi:hypothetical protein